MILLFLFVTSLFVSSIYIHFAAQLKCVHSWRTGYTRKVFHFLTFFTVAVIHVMGGLFWVCVYGTATSLVVFWAVWRGDGHPMYEALAREKDAPHRTYFILVPYVATLLGGLFNNFLLGGSAALAGYLVAGLGDAVGEPVGTKFGRDEYKVPSLSSVPATRTLQGSAAVFVVSYFSLIAAVALSPAIGWPPFAPMTLLILAFGCTLAEALSPHGWDNFTMQVLPVVVLMMIG